MKILNNLISTLRPQSTAVNHARPAVNHAATHPTSISMNGANDCQEYAPRSVEYMENKNAPNRTRLMTSRKACWRGPSTRGSSPAGSGPGPGCGCGGCAAGSGGAGTSSALASSGTGVGADRVGSAARVSRTVPCLERRRSTAGGSAGIGPNAGDVVGDSWAAACAYATACAEKEHVIQVGGFHAACAHTPACTAASVRVLASASFVAGTFGMQQGPSHPAAATASVARTAMRAREVARATRRRAAFQAPQTQVQLPVEGKEGVPGPQPARFALVFRPVGRRSCNSPKGTPLAVNAARRHSAPGQRR